MPYFPGYQIMERFGPLGVDLVLLPSGHLLADMSSAAPTSWALTQTRRLLRLAGAGLVEAHDRWAASDRRHLSEKALAQLAAMTLTTREVDHTDPPTAGYEN